MRQLALAALILAAVPSLAHAEVDESTITSPANPTYRLYEPERTLAEPRLRIEATTDAQNQEEVDVLCSYGNQHTVLIKDQSVDADGTLEVEVPLGRFPVELCDLRVVPVGYRGPDFTSFTGPVVAASSYLPQIDTAPVRGSEEWAVLNYAVWTGHQRAAAVITSAGAGGLFDAVGVKAQAHEPFGYRTWHEGAGIVELMVDGRRAYASADIPLFGFGSEQPTAPAGFESLQATVTLDEASGAISTSESQRIFRCDGTDDERPQEEDCRTVLDTGIRLERTVALGREHSIADVRDRWVSTDGRAHQVQVRYSVKEQDAKAAEDPLWRFPGDAAFRKYDEGDVLVPGPGTALVRDRNALSAPGALSFAPAPARFRIGDGQTLEEDTLLAVPAGGAVPVRRVFATARDDAEAAALGRATEDGFEAPRVVITGAGSRTVSGRATDNVGVVALTVGGRPAAVAADGTFSTPVTLRRGANEIAVTATDGAGLSTTTSVTVRRGAARRCRVPKVRAGVRVRAARAALRKAGCRTRTRRVASRSVRKGRVVGLTRRAGRTLPFRARVGIRVSAGR
jgi:glucodextranase-like protein